jgi:hypothetical protein
LVLAQFTLQAVAAIQSPKAAHGCGQISTNGLPRDLKSTTMYE